MASFGMKQLDDKTKQQYENKLSNTVSIPKAQTANAGNLMTDNMKASYNAYQQNLSKPVEPEKWYKGSMPTTGEMYGRIATIGQKDRNAANGFMQQFQVMQSTPGNPYYNAYLKPTNPAVGNLQAMGVDVSNIDDDWFNQNSFLQEHYILGGTTNTPQKPGKNATPTQRAAYEYYQLSQQRGNTNAYLQENAALQQELAYQATRPDRNWTDDEILENINWNKYPTLKKMRQSQETGVPIELNVAAPGYTDDWCRGAIWAARNDGGTGDWESDLAMSTLGKGNGYKENPALRAKLDATSDDYAPYSVGSTLEEEMLYFGVDHFDQKWLDDNRWMLNSNDETQKRMYQNVYNAELKTQELETQNTALNAYLDEQLKGSTDPQRILNRVKGNSDYSGLWAMDDSLGDAKLIGTTRAVDYRWKDVEARVWHDCARNANAKIAGVFASDLSGSLVGQNIQAGTKIGPADKKPNEVTIPEDPNAQKGTTTVQMPESNQPKDQQTAENTYAAGFNEVKENAPEQATASVTAEKGQSAAGNPGPIPVTMTDTDTATVPVKPRQRTTEQALEEQQVANIELAAHGIMDFGTDEEKLVFSTGRSVNFGNVAQQLADAKAEPEACMQTLDTNLKNGIGNEYMDASRFVSNYDNETAAIGKQKERLQTVTTNYDNLVDRYIYSNLWTDENLQNAELLTNSEEFTQIQALMESDNTEDRMNGVMMLNEFLGNVYGETPVMNASLFDSNVDWSNDISIAAAYPEVMGYYMVATHPIENAKPRQQYKGHDGKMHEDERVPLSNEEITNMLGYYQEQQELETDISDREAFQNAQKPMYDGYMADMKSSRAANAYVGSVYAMNGKEYDSTRLDALDAVVYAGGGFTPTQYYDGNIYDAAVNSGEFSHKDAAGYAQDAFLANSQTEEMLEQGLALCDELGIELTDQERTNVNHSISNAHNLAMMAGDFMIEDSPNYHEVVTEAMTTGVTDDMDPLTAWNASVLLNGYDPRFAIDRYGNNESKDAFQGQFFRTVGGNIMLDEVNQELFMDERISKITPAEKAKYFWYLKNDGADVANEYFLRLVNPDNGYVTVRLANETTEQLANIAPKGDGFGDRLAQLGWGILSIPTKWAGNFQSVATNLRNKWEGREQNRYDIGNMLSNAGNTMRASSLEDLTSGMSDTGKEVFSFFYNAMMSAGDSYANAVTWGPLFEEFGEAFPAFKTLFGLTEKFEGTKFGKFLSGGQKVMEDWLNAVPMALSAASEAELSATERGATPDQAKAIFWNTLFAESVTEAITYGNIHDMIYEGPETIKGFIGTLFSGGMEEFGGEAFNQWWEDNADKIIMQNMSEYQGLVDKYMEKYPKSVAVMMAEKEMFKNILIAGASGFVSSGFSSTGGYVTGAIGNGGFSALRDNTTKIITKEATVLGSIASSQGGGPVNSTNAAITISSVMRLGVDSMASDAASQKIVGDICEGNGQQAAQMMQGIILAAGSQNIEAKQAVAYAAMTDGLAHQELENIAELSRNGDKVLGQHVANLVSAFQQDQNGANAEALESQYVGAVKENRVASKVRDAMATGASAEKMAKLAANVSQKQDNLERAQGELSDLEGEKQAAADSVQAAAENQRNAPTPESNADLEQSLNELAGKDEQVRQKEGEVENAQQAVQEAKTEWQRQVEQKLTELRAEAAQAVEQEDQQRAVEQRQNQQNESVSEANQQADEAEAGINELMPQQEQTAEQPTGEQTEQTEQAPKSEAEQRLNAAREQLTTARQELEAAQQANDGSQEAMDRVDRAADEVKRIAQEIRENELTGQAVRQQREQMIDQYLDDNNIQGEIREDIRQKMLDRLDTNTDEKTDTSQQLNNVEGFLAVAAFGRRLGLETKMSDDTKNSEDLNEDSVVLGNARAMYSDGTIYLNSKLIKNGQMTVGQAIVEATLHEITHSMEQTKSYGKYSDLVRSILFKGDAAAEQQAIDLKIAQYRESGHPLTGKTQEEINNKALKEIVADFARTKLHNKDVVARFLEEGLAGKMRNTLHNINQMLKNYKLQGEERTYKENLRKAERLFQRMIDQESRESVHPEGNQFSIQQFAQATGLRFDENTLELYDQNGNKIDGVTNKITPEMMDNTPVGMLIDLAQKGATTQKGKLKFEPTISTETAQAQKQMFADLMNLVAQYKDSNLVWEVSSSMLFSALKSNSDPQYSTTVDFGTVCAKTQAIIDVMSETMLKQGRGLTRKEVLKVYDETANAGLTVPCPVCYVFSRWMGVPGLLNQMSQYQKRFVTQNQDGSINVEATQKAATQYVEDALAKYGDKDGIDKAKTSLQNRIKTQEKNREAALKVLNSETATEQEKAKAQEKHDNAISTLDTLTEELGQVEAYNWVTQALLDENGKVDPEFELTPDDVLFDLRRTGEFAKYAKNWRYRNTRGAGMGKAIMPYSGMTIGDIVYGTTRKAEVKNPFLRLSPGQASDGIKNAIARARMQNLIGGQRLQSTSDFRPEWGLDYMMAFLELQAVGSKVQMYTKVPQAVDLLASMGADVNLSIMGKGQGWHVDENGRKVLDFSDVTGMDYDIAKALKNKYSNVQMILVGMNDEHIRLAMADSDIDFIIPWHSSGNSTDALASMLSSLDQKLETSSDYTDTQSDAVSENQTEEQAKLWNLRLKILQRKNLTKAELDTVFNDEYLYPLYQRFKVKGVDDDCYQVKLGADQAKQIFPYEYWSKTLTKDQADKNGEEFVKYCQHFGIVPRFSGTVKKSDDGSFTVSGNFAGAIYDENGNITGYGTPDPGYWKLLIDRSMYDNDGNYRDQQVVDVTQAQIGFLEDGVLKDSQLPTETSAMYGPNYSEQEKTAVDNALAAINEPADINGGQYSVLGDVTDADIDQMLGEAGVRYQEAVESGDMDTAQRLVDEKAKEAGYDTGYLFWRGDSEPYNVLEPGEGGNLGRGLYFTEQRSYAEKFARGGVLRKFYLKRTNGSDVTSDGGFEDFRYFQDQWLEDNGYDPENDYIEPEVASEIFDDYIAAHDFDYLEGTNVGGLAYGASETSIQNPWQAKLADPVTYDDEGNVIPLEERFQSDNPDIRYSTGGELTDADVDQMLVEAGVKTGQTTDITPPTNLPQQSVGEAGNAYRQFGRYTAQESDALHEDVKNYLYNHSMYNRDTNAEQIDRAIGWVQSHASGSDPTGFYSAMQEVLREDFNAMSADGQAQMLTLMSMAALDGNHNAETDLAMAFNEQGTKAGQTLQARKIFRMMTPLGRQSILLKMQQKINDEYQQEGNGTRVNLNPLILQAAAEATTEKEFDAVRKAANEDLAKQMPADWKGRLRTWRMMSMLLNPRTHFRNIVGNALFVPTVGLKNIIGTGLERVFVKEGERTKSIRHNAEATAFAENDFNEVQAILTGEAKYGPDRQIDMNRKYFGQKNTFLSRTLGRAVQGAADFNSALLENEDAWFLHGHYVRALSGWMTANNVTEADFNNDPAMLERARQYAINEAQKATYRDANWLAEKLSKAGQMDNFGGFLVNATIPFKKTPANILRRGIEYSPLGLVQSIYTLKRSSDKYAIWEQNGFKGPKPKGARTLTENLDRIAAGMTGTMIAAVGAFFARMGWVTLKLGDDPEDRAKTERGYQDYSLNIFGHSFTIDWAAPVCMPLFLGASIYEAFSEEGEPDFGKLLDGLVGISEPIFNLSMLDGVSGLLRTSSYSGLDTTLPEIFLNIMKNYATSYIPSISGATARTIDPTRRRTYTESGTGMVWGKVNSAIEQTQNKIPFLSMENTPYRNAFGEEDTSPTWFAFLENFILPGYVNKIKDDEVIDELERIYQQTGEDVLPKSVAGTKTLKVNGENVILTDKQNDAYQAAYGSTAKNTLADMIKRPEFMGLTVANPDAQVALVNDVTTYAKSVARHEVFPDAPMDTWIKNAYESGDPAGYIINRREEAAKSDAIKTHKAATSQAIIEGNFENAATSVAMLKEAGVDDKTIRDSIMKKVGPVYKQAYLDGDDDTIKYIESTMLQLDLGGSSFDNSTFKKWKDAARESD